MVDRPRHRRNYFLRFTHPKIVAGLDENADRTLARAEKYYRLGNLFRSKHGPGTTEPEAVDFINRAAAIIHNADPFHRPVTASLADFGDWSGFYRSDSIDFINIHPYPVSGKLDTTIISAVRSMLAKYQQAGLIGESGLSFETPDSNPATLTTADRADIGIKHAIWAAVVSGAMNGRALWWEDGVAIYFPALSMPFIRKYADAELPAANFVRGVDFTGFHPLTSTSSPGIWGAAVGNEKMVLGWYRDATSEPPNWNLKPGLRTDVQHHHSRQCHQLAGGFL